MSNENTLTDRSYELVEALERRKKWLNAIIVVCFVLAPIGLGIDSYVYMNALHLKGDWSDMSMMIIAMVSAISGLLLIIGIKEYNNSKELNEKLGQVEKLEETIYNEVINPNALLLKR